MLGGGLMRGEDILRKALRLFIMGLVVIWSSQKKDGRQQQYIKAKKAKEKVSMETFTLLLLFT